MHHRNEKLMKTAETDKNKIQRLQDKVDKYEAAMDYNSTVIKHLQLKKQELERHMSIQALNLSQSIARENGLKKQLEEKCQECALLGKEKQELLTR